MLENIWFALWGLLWAVYFLLDGFDLGLGSLLPFLAKNEDDRQAIHRAMGPFWDGNEVWLITAGGVTFAAFPAAYAAMFSALYSPLLLLLFALILRGVALEYRGQSAAPGWRRLWDTCLVLGSFLPALLLGVAFANLSRIPLAGDGTWQGSLPGLLNPYGLLGGALFVLLFCQHGALWLANRATGELAARARALAGRLWPFVLLVAAVFLAASAVFTNLYANYLAQPVLWLLPLFAVLALVLTRVYLARGRTGLAWVASAKTIAFCTFFGGRALPQPPALQPGPGGQPDHP